MASPLYLILVTDPVPHDHGCALCLGSGSQFDPQRGPTGSLASASAVPRRGSTKEFVQIRHEPVVGGDQLVVFLGLPFVGVGQFRDVCAHL